MDGIRELLADICLVSAAAFFVAWAMLVNRGRLAWAADRIAKTSHAAMAAFLFFAAIATVCAQKSGTNAPLRGASGECRVGSVELRNDLSLIEDEQFHNSTLYTLNSQLPQFPFRLESVTTNDSYSYAMPTNVARYGKWWKRGAYEDVFRLDLCGMRFPLGTNLCDSLWVYSWAFAGARLRDASNRVVAAGVPMSAVPGFSQFWSTATTNETYLLTWQDFALGRDTNELVSAQLELCPTGDYIARSNDVERVYRRVNPDDWDDDGDPNDTDPNPYAFDEGGFGPHQTLPEGANEDAYCWVEIVVSNANALVTFTGDGPSALPDPRFIARAGETYRVIILIGKTYAVTYGMPIAVGDKSDAAIIVRQAHDRKLTVCWPVEIYADEIQMRGGAAFSMSVWPDCLDGSFVWTNSCCSVSHSGGVFVYPCNDACHCTGCCAMGYYGYESYRLPAYGGWCGCSSVGEHDDRPGEEDDDGPYDAGAYASFSKSAVIFEDGYYNTPTSRVERRSTQTSLRCVAHGGPNGGHVRFEILGEEKLERVSGHDLPVEQDVSPGKKLDFTIVYKGQLPSSAAEDIIVTTTFAENVQGAQPEVDEEKLTCVRVTLESTSFSLDDFPNRHIRGIGESVSCEWTPSAPGLSFQTRNGAVCTESYDNIRIVTCPFHAAS